MVRYLALAALSVALVSLGAPAGGANKPEAGTKLDGAWKLDGGRWHHKGTIKTDQGDIPIDELWERVKK
jgi:hypothetical protein